MNWIILAGLLLVLVFGIVVMFGAPYLPVRSKQLQVAIELLGLKKGQILLELGCGDGRVLKVAAARGWNVVGYELNPVLVIVSRLRTWRYRRQVQVIWGNYWQAKWPPADGIFVFLLDRYMKKLDKKITQYNENNLKIKESSYKHKPDTRLTLVSYAFKIPGKKPVKESSGMYLYHY